MPGPCAMREGWSSKRWARAVQELVVLFVCLHQIRPEVTSKAWLLSSATGPWEISVSGSVSQFGRFITEFVLTDTGRRQRRSSFISVSVEEVPSAPPFLSRVASLCCSAALPGLEH